MLTQNLKEKSRYYETWTCSGRRVSYWEPQYPMNQTPKTMLICVATSPTIQTVMNRDVYLPPRPSTKSLRAFQVIRPWTISPAKISFPSDFCSFLSTTSTTCFSRSISSCTASASRARTGSLSRAVDISDPTSWRIPSRPIETTKSAIGAARAMLCV